MRSLNPATEEVIADYPEDSTEQVEAKILKADLRKPFWTDTTRGIN